MNRILPSFLWCFLILQVHSFPLFVVACCMYVYKYRDYTVFIFILVVLFCMYTQTRIIPSTHQGKITQLTTKSIVIENEGARTLVSNCNIRDYDQIIQVEGEAKKVESALSTYGFSFANYAKQNRIDTTIYATSCTLIKENNTIRSQFQKIINTHTNKEFLYKIFFNVSSEDNTFSDVLNSIGFPFVGFIALFKMIAKRFIYTSHITCVEGILIILNCFFNGFNFISMRILFGFICRYIPVDSHCKSGIFGFLCMFFYPTNITSLSFIIPFGFRCIQCTHCNKRWARYFFLTCIQSIFFSKVQLGMILFYPIVQLSQGVMYCVAIVGLFFTSSYQQFFQLMTIPISFLQTGSVYGNPIGFGIILYLILLLLIKKHRIEIATILIFVFLYLGLFHPFSEVIFIQIGQGDCILIRTAFNQSNYLIDTGESKNYSLLKSALRARSIHKIDALFISHMDDDHSGNMNQVMKDFNVLQLITTHDDFSDRFIVIDSLNHSLYQNENDNSLVNLVNINHVSFLFTGDISKAVEKNMLKSSDRLPIDILKVGHHGSKSSTSRELLVKTQPKVAIISSGLNNKYNHPHKETIEILEKFDVFWLDTKNEGDISIIFTRFFNFFITSSGKIGIITLW